MQINWNSWIENGGEAKWKPLRQAIHIVLMSISKCESLKDHMMLKGGILMALCYDSSRYTRDIDFSQKEKYQQGDENKLLNELNSAIQETVEEMDYGLDCKIQSHELRPRNQTNPTFPTLKLKIGYAYKHDHANHRRLAQKQATTVVEIDFSFNETTKSAEEFNISDGNVLLRYSLVDLMAEKFRALLQQEVRKRNRRQDIYDILHLLKNFPKQIEGIKPDLLEALIQSTSSKELEINPESMNEGKIREMSKQEYNQLEAEVANGTLVDFDIAYEKVTNFYKSLPWDNQQH